MNTINMIVKYLIPITNFLLASVAFYFTFSKFREEKPSISIHFPHELRELLVDRHSDKIPDEYWHTRYRLIPTIVITNNSSKPITVYEFELNDNIMFNVHTLIGEKYITTYSSNKRYEKGFTFYSSKPNASSIIDLTQNPILKPVFVLEPHESKVGSLIFHYDEPLPINNILRIKTSRKNFTFDIKVVRRLYSVLQNDYERPQLD